MESTSGKMDHSRSKENYAKILMACETGSKTCNEIIKATGLTEAQVRYALEVHDMEKRNAVFKKQNGKTFQNYKKIKEAFVAGIVSRKEIALVTDLSISSIKRTLRIYDEDLYNRIFAINTTDPVIKKYVVIDTSCINLPDFDCIKKQPLIFISTVILELECKAKSEDFSIACKARKLLDLVFQEQNLVLSAKDDLWLEGWPRNNDSKIVASVRYYIQKEGYEIEVYTYDKVMASQCKALDVQIPYRYFITVEKLEQIELQVLRKYANDAFYIRPLPQKGGKLYMFKRGRVITPKELIVKNQEVIYLNINNYIYTLRVIDASKGIAEIIKKTTLDANIGLLENIKNIASQI